MFDRGVSEAPEIILQRVNELGVWASVGEPAERMAGGYVWEQGHNPNSDHQLHQSKCTSIILHGPNKNPPIFRAK